MLSAVILSFCVAALSVLGLMRFTTTPLSESRQDNAVVEVILLPYVTLAICMILILIFLFFRRLFGGTTSTKKREHFDEGMLEDTYEHNSNCDVGRSLRCFKE